MTAQPRKHRDREPGPADSSRRISGQPPPDDITAATASRAGRDSHGRQLAHSVDEAARLTGLSRDLLCEEMRRSNLVYVKVGRRRLITRQHLQHVLGIAS
jgi:excisionase family DNA binding protein